MEWHVFRSINNNENDKFLIDCKLKSGILKFTIIQNSAARSAEVGKT